LKIIKKIAKLLSYGLFVSLHSELLVGYDSHFYYQLVYAERFVQAGKW